MKFNSFNLTNLCAKMIKYLLTLWWVLKIGFFMFDYKKIVEPCSGEVFLSHSF